MHMELHPLTTSDLTCSIKHYRKNAEAVVMHPHQTSLDASIPIALLKLYAKEKNLLKGTRLHANMLRSGLMYKNIFIGSSIIDMYVKCGALAKARDVFEKLPVRDTVSWNALIAGYAHNKHGEEALSSYIAMQYEGLQPDPVTIACSLKACASIGTCEKGETIHAEAVKFDFIEKHVIVANALIDMYVKCGALVKGQKVFDDLPTRSVVAWTALITGYCQHEQYQEALACFERMRQEGISPNPVTFASALKACASIKAVEKGQEIHCEIVTKGLLKNDVVLGNALLTMYVRAGTLKQAQEVFDQLKVRNDASWTGLIGGFCQQGNSDDAIVYFEQMRKEGFPPSSLTFVCILKACGSIRAVEKGREVHVEVARKGLLGACTALGNALVDMYGKCGVIDNAQEVFDKLPLHDVVSWTALIAGYCEQGQGEKAVSHFRRMKQKGFSPDAVTYSFILKAYGTMGETNKRQLYFDFLSTMYGVIPSLQHLADLVALFACQGQFNKMLILLKRIPSSDCILALINACKKWGNADLGRLAFENALEKNAGLAASEVLIGQILESHAAQKWFAF
ncbi:hypothetical protein KP509_23G082400 [Ceratopteris richardii]|nr:hypothetical protein KP509_23G082400 [Ceratopteris richardii]